MSAPALKLYDHAEALAIIENWIYEHDEEIRAAGGALPDELARLLEETELAFKDKAERVALFIRELLANAKAVKEEEQRLAARRQHYERAAESLKGYLLVQMQRGDIPKVEGKFISVRVQASPPKVMCDIEPSALPAEFQIIPPPPPVQLDRTKVLDLWKAEKPLPLGVAVVQDSHLRLY